MIANDKFRKLSSDKFVYVDYTVSSSTLRTVVSISLKEERDDHRFKIEMSYDEARMLGESLLSLAGPK